MSHLGKFVRLFSSLLKETFLSWQRDNGSMLAAALAYSMIFSLSPLLVLATSVAGIIFNESEVIERLVMEVHHTVGPRAGEALRVMLEAGRVSTHPGMYTSISVVLMLIFASLVFSRMKRAINVMWEITGQPGQGLLLFIRTHFLSFVMVMVTITMLLIFMVASTLVVSINQWLRLNAGDVEPLLTQADIGLTFVGFTTLFVIIFKTMPDAQTSWDDVLIGAAFTSVLFTIGEFLIGFYLSRVSLRGIYGATSSIIIVLAWVYYSMQIITFGAKFTLVYANRYGKKIIPTKRAAKVVPRLETYD
jgi:membrane protein